MKTAVVGAGIVGLLTAHALSMQDHEVSLFESPPLNCPKKDQINAANCSYAAAGMISPIAELKTAEKQIYDLGRRSLELWPKLLSTLNTSVSYQQHGSILLALGNDQAELTLYQTQLQRKLPDATLQQLNTQQLQQLEPELNHATSYFIPNEAHINVQELLTALQANCQTNTQTTTYIDTIRPHTITSNNTTYTYDWVFDCRGLGARDDIPGLHAVRGELLWLHAPKVRLQRPIRIYHPRYPLYVVPRDNHHYIIGATEIDGEDYSPISVQSSLELLSAAYALHPGFAEARVVKSYAQCRPTLPNHLPYIEHQPGLTRINGLYRHGYLASPALIEQALLTVTEMTTHASVS